MHYILFLFLSLESAHANPVWFLNNAQIKELSTIAAPAIFTDYSFIILNLVVLIIIVTLFAFACEHYFLKRFNNTLDKILLPIAEKHCAAILRIFLGLMLILFSFGALSHLGIGSIKHPVLFAPNIDLILLSKISAFWIIMNKIQMAIGIMLVIGFYTRINIFALLSILSFCTMKMGIVNFPYIFYYLPACLLLFYLGNGKSVTTNLPSYNQKKEDLIQKKLNWTKLYRLILSSSGLILITYAFFINIMQPNLLIIIFEKAQIMSFGMTYDKFIFVLAFCQIAAGCLLIMGILIRPISAIILISIIMFSSALGAPILFYGHIIAIFITNFMLGNHPLVNFEDILDHEPNEVPLYQSVYEDYA